jgi:hypothetical protein
VTTNDLLKECSVRGVRLYLDGGQLRYEASCGALPDVLRAQLRDARTDVVAALRSRDRMTCCRCGDESSTVRLQMDNGEFLCRGCYQLPLPGLNAGVSAPRI